MMIDYRAPLEELPDPLPIVPLEKPFDVTITPPGSKSITNRAYVLAALAEGESKIIRPLRAEDTDLLLEALCTLGAEARWEGEDVFIKGVGGRFPRGGLVYLGDGGTPTRFMIAAACLAAEPVVVDGSKRMRERPIAEGIEMLRQLGATIEYVEEEGRLPVRVVPSDAFKGGELRVGRTASSQFISAVMLIAQWLEGGATIKYSEGVTSAAYVWLTYKVMDEWHIGVSCSFNHERGWLRIHSDEAPTTSGRIEGVKYTVQCDASSAAYWYVAAAMAPKSCACIQGLSLDDLQPDMGVPAVLTGRGGIHDDLGQDFYALWRKGRLHNLSCDATSFPDGAVALAVAASAADGTSTITGLHTLRVKETDRLAALANELRKVGCEVETTEDSITITPPAQLAQIDAASDDRTEEDADGSAGHAESNFAQSGSPSLRSSDPAPVVIETYNDHRMAMSFAILGLVRPGISIRNPKCVAKSYPTFWQDFAKLYE